MRELGVDGLTEDKRFLIVRDLSTDEQFRVPLGEETAKALSIGSAGSDVPTDATGPELGMTTILTPREIQTRIRRGESPDDVATSAGVPITQVEPFAGPVLAEREYMAQQAQRTTVRRTHVTGAGVRLSALIDAEVRAHDGNPEKIQWDAFRREDGRWTVLVTVPEAHEAATFLYDVEGRYVTPADEAAHELVGDVALPDTPDMALADVVRESGRVEVEPAPAVEPTDVSEEEHEDHESAHTAPEADSGELELDLGLPPDIAAAEAQLDPPVSTVASLKEARDRRAQSAMAQQAEELPTDDAPEQDHLEQSIDHDVAVPDTDAPTKKRHERRRVPSWDEIMFGDRQD